MEFKFRIMTRQTKRHGLAFDLYIRWKGVRYRPLLGYNLTSEEAQQAALLMLQKIQSGHRVQEAQEQIATLAGWSMNAMMRIAPSQRGHTSGSAS